MEVRPTEILLCFSMTYWGTAVRSVEDMRETINVHISQGEWPAGVHRVGKRVEVAANPVPAMVTALW